MSPQRRYLNRKQRELNTLRGIPNRVDATEARNHIVKLRQTMGWNAIAAATRCSACHLRYIADGRTTTINRVTHERILATPAADAPTAGLYIDATGTRRRVHALQALGYSQLAIAKAANTTQHRISIVSLGAQHVRQKLADKIAHAYTALADTPPADTRFTRRTRHLAQLQGWRDPAFWEDYDRIDDPDFNPTTVDRALRRDELGAIRRAEITHLASYGYDRETIHKRLVNGGHDIAESTVQGILTEYHTGTRRDRRKKPAGVAA